MIYALKSAVVLTLLYICFYLLLRRETFHRFNRVILMSILLVSVAVPLIPLTTTQPTVINKGLYNMEMRMQTYRTAQEKADETLPDSAVTDARRVDTLAVVQCLFGLGVAVRLAILLLNTVALVRQIRSGLYHTDRYGNTIVLKRGNIPPFSIFHFIVMSVDDYEHHRPYIIAHEQEHIRLGHSYDLLLLETVCVLQ